MMTVPKAKLTPRPSPSTTLRRPRLDTVLDQLQVDEHRLGVVIGPAGSGKTTLLAQFAAVVGSPVAWYRAEVSDRSVEACLPVIEQSLRVALPRMSSGVGSIDELASTLDRLVEHRVLLVVDDLHTLLGSPAEAALQRLVDYAPTGLRFLFASRCRPGFDLSRLRVSGDLVEIGPEDLRFRTWEVERLFRDFYGEPLPPEDLAELARRTEGWAAGLQLFHLATRGKPTAERRRVLGELGSRSRMVREYLAYNVLNHLPERLRDFLIDSCVLGRLTGTVCDALLGTAGSEHVLEELERRQVFTVAVDPGVYRYHEVLRSHLEFVLVEKVGEAEARRRYREAGELLESTGASTDALRAYCRAEDWDAIAELLGKKGQQLASGQGAWLDTLPAGLLDQDPWLILARARRHLALGCLEAALCLYERAEAAFATAPTGDICRREREALGLWLDPSPLPRRDWMGLLRSATQRHPLAAAEVASRLPDVRARFTEGVATLLAGHLERAHDALTTAADLPDAPPVLATLARLLIATTAFARDHPPGETLVSIADDVEALEIPWLDRICHLLAAHVEGGLHSGTLSFGRQPDSSADPWTLALTAFAEGVAGLMARRCRADRFEASAVAFRGVGAGVGEVWARCGRALALALEGDPEAAPVALDAARLAREAGVRGAEALPLAALALVEPQRSGEHLARARTIAAECGFRLLPLDDRPAPAKAPAPPPLCSRARVPAAVVTCLGGFRMELGGRVLGTGALRPRYRTALRLLALHAGRSIHRESVVEALWPEADECRGARNLHVAISTIRRFLEPELCRGAPSLIVRDGDTYRLALPEDSVVDLWTLTSGLADGRAARTAGDLATAATAFHRAVQAYGGDLLPEDGPAEWVVKERDRYRLMAAEAAQSLAEVHLTGGDAAAATAAAEHGLRIDRYRDGLWRALVATCEFAGDQAAAARARRSYDEVLAELGIAVLPASKAGGR
jgi:DNA-binding SARP family transcriptional activator/energy-coupling factor transporter ATP-binding protein EcfA2